SESPETFSATARELDLGQLNVVELTCSPLDVWRTPQLIKDYDPDLCAVLFPVRGRIGVIQADRETTLGTHGIALYDSSHPSTLRSPAEGATAHWYAPSFPGRSPPSRTRRSPCCWPHRCPGRKKGVRCSPNSSPP